ncbi:MAG: DUF58 domain-containing protein [Magnetococcales bacterium]|nr:DUF58 domain-containing protein [Magnetococcales bacterium]
MSISSRFLSGKRSSTTPFKDSAVSVHAKELIALHQEAKGVKLKPTRIRSTMSGQYISPYIGRGMTFAESRPYQSGDDARHMDWRVTARTGKAYTKLFQEERERSIFIFVDFRSPMFFATKGRFKSVQAARTAAWVAWAARNNNDRIGGLIFSEQQHWELRPKTGDKSVLRLIHTLSSAASFSFNGGKDRTTNGEIPLTQSLVRLRRVVKPGSQLFLLSDFRNLDHTGEAHLKQLAKHNEIVIVFYYDPLERSLPKPGLYPVDFGRGIQTLNTRNTKSRDHYQSQFNHRQEHLMELCRKLNGYFLTISTTDDAITTLKTAFQS